MAARVLVVTSRALIAEGGAMHLLRDQGELCVFQGEGAWTQIADKIGVYQAHAVRVR
jgi:hypothetical protein